MSDRPIHDLWDDWKTLVIPDDAPPIQISECRKAFYAGAASMLGLMLTKAGDDPDDTRLYDEVQADLVKHTEEVRAERLHS